MIECLILGDSIAVGVAQFRHECTAIAKVGINSRTWINRYDAIDANTVAISLGTNDPDVMNTANELRRLRDTIHAKRVIWFLPPVNDMKRRAVMQVAASKGDITVDVRDVPLSPDHIHPTREGYRRLAKTF